MIKPKISVVIAVRNRSHFLKETLHSLKNQTIEEWEAIVADDYSTEDIKAIVEEVNDERIHYVRNEGTPGPSAARNVGNALAQASLIAVADSDDIILPRRLEVSLKYFDEHPETDVFYSRMYNFPDGTYAFRNHSSFIPYNRDELYERDFIPHVTVVYKKDLISEFPYDETLLAAIDYEMLLKFADRNKVFGWVEEPLTLYRRHADQISTDAERKVLQKANAARIKIEHAPYRLNPIID